MLVDGVQERLEVVGIAENHKYQRFARVLSTETHDLAEHARHERRVLPQSLVYRQAVCALSTLETFRAYVVGMDLCCLAEVLAPPYESLWMQSLVGIEPRNRRFKEIETLGARECLSVVKRHVVKFFVSIDKPMAETLETLSGKEAGLASHEIDQKQGALSQERHSIGVYVALEALSSHIQELSH